MENIKPGMFYIAADGDGVGKLVGRAVIANNVEELHKVSNRIDAAQDFILHWCKENDGVKVSGGGDEFTAAIPKEALAKLESLRESIEKSFGYTLSVGVGRSLSESGTALLVAKLRGKDRIVYFNKKIKEDIKKAKRRVREKRATPDEYKLSEAYLKKADSMICDLHKSRVCDLHKSEEGKHNGAADKEDRGHQHPDDEDNRTDDCNYCQDLDAQENADGTAGMHDCQMCADYDAKNGTTGGIEGCQACEEYDNEQNSGGVDGCPMCEDMANEQANPEQSEDHNCNCPKCPKKDETGLAVEDMGAEHPDNCPECQEMYGDAVEEQPGQTGQEDPNLQGHETAEEVLDLLDNEPGSDPSPAEAAKKIDNTELPQGDQMKGNASVPEDFGAAQKEEMSDSEQDMAQDDHECNCPDCPGSQKAQDPMAQELGQEMSQLDESGQEPMADDGQDEPDMAGVLQDGLDDHANEQKKQQVLDMVGQTLAGFKANKASLEATKEQNQPLYNSCIQMLKSMISLCDLLGLKPQSAPAAPAPEQAAPEQQPPAASQEGSPDPKAVGQE
jgi:hypothetical protein